MIRVSIEYAYHRNYKQILGQWCFQGERGGTPSPHLFYQGNGVPPAKIKHGGTPFPLAGIKYEWSSVDAVRHSLCTAVNSQNLRLYTGYVRHCTCYFLAIIAQHLRGNTSERNFVTILISMELDILAENSSQQDILISIVFRAIAKLNIKMNIKIINGNIKWFNKIINMINWERFKDIYYLRLFSYS
jgi:hypothetical protein